MNKDWPSEEQDILDASHILDKYAEYNEDGVLQGIEIVIDQKENSAHMRAPSWMKEVVFYFEYKYGAREGGLVAQKVITKWLLQGVIIH